MLKLMIAIENHPNSLMLFIRDIILIIGHSLFLLLLLIEIVLPELLLPLDLPLNQWEMKLLP